LTDSAGSTINGNLSLTLAAGNANLSGNIGGNATVRALDNGMNFRFDTGTIAGALNVFGGNGANLAAAPLTGTVRGVMTVNFGNGNNGTWNFNTGFSVGRPLRWTSGNGPNQVALNAPGNFNLNVQFGNADDTFTLNNAGAVVSGRVDGGGRITANVFNYLAGTIGSPFTLSNFP
jgi:hypothetical protein